MSRSRANTFFGWRKPRPLPSGAPSGPEAPPVSVPHTPQPVLDIADLISALTPPAVPSLTYARTLASLLPTTSPAPRRSQLVAIWFSLCAPDRPTAVQAAGYDLMGAYFENEQRQVLTTADRLTLFSLFTTCRVWAADTWEPRLKALRGMTGYGSDILGIEDPMLELLKFWIQAAFDGLLVLEARAINMHESVTSPLQYNATYFANERNERNERERCITLCAEFITKILDRSENMARIPDEDLDAIVAFYGTLVDRAIQLPRSKGYDPASEEPDDVLSPSMTSAGPTFTRSTQSHRRTTSTSTTASGITPTSPPEMGLAYLKHPTEIAIHLYLTHLSSQSKMLTPQSLQDIIPTLFRATAFCATPLSRLSVVARHHAPSSDRYQPQASTSTTSPNWKHDTEERITTFLAQFLSGPYAALSKLILKIWLGPPGTTPNIPPLPPLFAEFSPPSVSTEFLPSTLQESQSVVAQPSPARSQTHPIHGQQILPAPATERFTFSSLTSSPVPTQPATPVPPVISLPTSALTAPTSPIAHFVSPALPTISVQLPSLQASLPHLPSLLQPSSAQPGSSSGPSGTYAPSSASATHAQGQGQERAQAWLGTGQAHAQTQGGQMGHYPLPLHQTSHTLAIIHTSLGAHRTARTALRRSLMSRLARTYISREASLGYTMGGVPARVDVEWEAMERAWPSVGDAMGFLKEAGGPARGHEWDIVRVGRILRWAVRSWIRWEVDVDRGGANRDAMGMGKGKEKGKGKEREKEERLRLKEATERVLEEIAGMLKDLLQEVDERGDDDYSYDLGGGAGYAGANPSGVAGSQMEEDESVAIGEVLFQLAGWFKGLRKLNGTAHIIRLHPQSVAGRPRLSHSVSQVNTFPRASTSLVSTPALTPTPVSSTLASTVPVPGSPSHPSSPTLIRTLTTLLSRSHFTTPLRPLLSLTLASLSDHLTDADLAPLPDIMMRTHELSPTSLDWLTNWRSLLGVSYITEQPALETKKDMKKKDVALAEHDLTWLEEIIFGRESDRWENFAGASHLPGAEEGESEDEEFERCAGLIGLGGQLNRRKTREEAMVVLDRTYDSVRDMGTYRRALADVVCEFATQIIWWGVDATSLGGGMAPTGVAQAAAAGVDVRDEFEVVWRLLADEVVLRTVEGLPMSEIELFLQLVLDVAGDGGVGKVSQESKSAVVGVLVEGAAPGTVGMGTPSASGVASPVISRMQSEYVGIGIGTGTIVMPTTSSAAGLQKEGREGTTKEGSSGGSGLISLLSSLAAGTTSGSTVNSSATSTTTDDSPVSPNVTTNTTPASASNVASNDASVRQTNSPQPMLSPEAFYASRSLCGVSALVSMFSQLAFSPFVMDQEGVQIVIRVYEALLSVAGGTEAIGQNATVEARLAALTFLMRLRADNDHRVFFIQEYYDANGSVEALSGLVGRVKDIGSGTDKQRTLSHSGSVSERGETTHKMRSRPPQERLGRQGSRGRGVGAVARTSSRSRSRVPSGYPTGLQPQVTMPVPIKARDPLWYYPEMLPFGVETDSPSEALTTHDSQSLQDAESYVHLHLPISKYVEMLISILENEKEWELISYTLCHLPIQLANKHFFCGPKTHAMLSRMLNTICTGILNKTLAAECTRQRDALGLAHHTLEVMIGYRKCFEPQQLHVMIEVFHAGLNEQPSTVKCSLHALTIAAFEFPRSTTKFLPKILENLSQIMTNPEMAVHILAYIGIVASLPPLYANFTEDDFKMVFGVALQYLQHYSRHNASPTLSWALSQHVRVLSYYVIYIWFLALRLPDRVKYIKFITRQLLIANEGNEAVDGPTEVCFDWLARYTYATADPRPANSFLADNVMNPTNEQPSEVTEKEKTWVIGNAVVTIRALPRLGWLEVLMRRPSGFTKFLCRVENAPMVGPGEVDLDRVSIPATLLMGRDPPQVLCAGPDDYEGPLFSTEEAQDEQLKKIFDNVGSEGPELPRPDPITGYVWKGSAPSQRRKEVAVDPSYFAIQFSPYPAFLSPPETQVRADSAMVAKFANGIDRIPVIDTHKVGVLYVAPGQTNEIEILRNTHGSPAYTRFLEGLGRLINLRGQLDVYAGGLDPDEDGEYAYAWWDDIGQILYHTATLMPTSPHDPQSNNKKRHVGNDYVRIVWNDSGLPYRFDTLSTQFQFVNIVIEPHSPGGITAYSNSAYEKEYFKVTVQRAPGMTEFAPVGNFKLISGQNLPLLVRQLSLLADWFVSIFAQTSRDTTRTEVKTNWQMRLEAIRRFKNNLPVPEPPGLEVEGIMKQEAFRDYTLAF
ncbi:hypothetical protein APHAL10511_005471 [Amanita phalloides]|nr:hypothetical protein APHAL10511_005471 [Amanita phalloides]